MVTFVVLNWNNPELTINAIENLEKYEFDSSNNFIVIVVDNGSEKSKRELLVEYFLKNNGLIFQEEELLSEEIPDIWSKEKILILNRENYGYAKGNNIGLKFAKKLGFEYAVVMNNDIELTEKITGKLLQVIKSSEEIAVVGPNVLGPNGKPQGPFEKSGIYSEFIVPIFFPFSYIFEKIKRKSFRKRLFTEFSAKGYVDVYRVMGCFMLVDLNKMEKVGWFDEKTFLYAEEPILSEKLKKFGYKTVFVPDVSVLHHHEFSTKASFGNKRWLLQLNSDLYYYKNYRNYNNFKLLLVKIGRLYKIYVLAPLYLFLKNKIFKS